MKGAAITKTILLFLPLLLLAAPSRADDKPAAAVYESARALTNQVVVSRSVDAPTKDRVQAAFKALTIEFQTVYDRLSQSYYEVYAKTQQRAGIEDRIAANEKKRPAIGNNQAALDAWNKNKLLLNVELQRFLADAQPTLDLYEQRKIEYKNFEQGIRVKTYLKAAKSVLKPGFNRAEVYRQLNAVTFGAGPTKTPSPSAAGRRWSNRSIENRK
jgi:hypothetical protein